MLMLQNRVALDRSATRRFFIGALLLANVGLSSLCCGEEPGRTIHVLVWDEQQPSRKWSTRIFGQLPRRPIEDAAGT